MRNSNKARLILLVLVAFVAVFALSALAGCDDEVTVGDYYLSVYTNGAWTTYKSNDDIPTANKFVVDTANEKVYNLTIDLEEGALVKIAQVNSTETYGGEQLFSALTVLTAGTDNALVVGKSGTFKFTFDTSDDNSISYTFTAKPSQSEDEPPVDDPVVVLVEIDDAANFTLTYPATKQLTATATLNDESTSTEDITWVSSQTGVATVEGGLVKSVSAGTTQIKAACGDVESDPITVTVNGTVTLNKSTLTLSVDGSEKLTATVAGGATTKTWSSTNEDVATVDQEGNVTAVGPGTTEIRLAYLERPDAQQAKFVICTVTVSVPLEDIALASTLTVAVDGTQDLTVTFVPANASNQNYTYVVTQDDNIISVEKNAGVLTVTGLKQGSATIAVTTEEGNKTKSCTVTVVEAGSEFANDIDPQSVTLNKGGTGTLTVSGVGISGVAWSSSSSSIVGVVASETDNKIATITGAGFGTATITATISFVSGGSDTKTVDVLVSPEQMWVYGDIIEGSNGWDLTDTYAEAAEQGMTLTKSANGVFSGEFHLPAGKDFRIAHDNFDWKGFRWEHISSVAGEKQNVVQGGNDQNSGYNVRVSKAGTYTVTVDLTQGAPVLKISCVSVDVTDISVSTDESTLTSGGSVTVAVITLTITPEDATYVESDIVWELTNESLVTKALSNGNKTITITAKDGLAQGGVVRVTASLKGKEKYVDITIVGANQDIVAVSTIAFEHDTYTFNVNKNGAFDGAGTVKASVNSDATNQGVTYSTTDSGITVDPATGAITATKVGTFTITATAAGNSEKTDTCTVTFYSDMFYVSGIDGWGDTGTNSTTVGTKFENFTFTDKDDSHTEFTLDVIISGSTTFQIMFVGAGSTWDYAITGSNSTISGSASASGSNISISTAGLYTITLDISGTKPSVSAVSKGSIPTYTAKLMKDSEEVVSSENSTVASNRYAMTLTTTFDAQAEYTIKVGEDTLAITSLNDAVLSGDDGSTTLFTLSDNTLTCVTAGKYRLTVVYNPANKSCSVSVEQIKDAWIETSDFTLSEWHWNETTTIEATTYYNSSSGQYKMYFSYDVTSETWFNFSIVVDGNWNDLQPKTVYSVLTNNATSIFVATDSYETFEPKSNGTVYFEVVFTVSGNTVTFVSVTADTSNLNTMA